MEATQKQTEYIEILCNDVVMSRIQRNDYISLRVGRPIKFLDELTKIEASQIITELKLKKDTLKDRASDKPEN